MIKLDNISFSYASAGKKEQLKNISLHIKSGEFILLTGKSGCGKTTLTRILNGLCPNFYPGTIKGSYYIKGKNAKDIPISEMGTMVGNVFQDPRSQFFSSNTTDEIVLGMENHAVPRDEMVKRFWNTIPQIGVESLLDKRIFPLSSGEKQKIALASVCTMQPDVLVLDEPSSNLDSDTITHLSKLLYSLKEAGTTIILSEHRLHYVKDFFDRMILLEDGKIHSEYSRKESLALTDTKLEKMGLRNFNTIPLKPGKYIKDSKNAILFADQISLALGTHRVLDEVCMSAGKGKILAITGGNGAGKSSLCKVLTGLYKQNIGQVFMNNVPLKNKKRIRSTFYVQQDTDYQLYAATVEDEFHIGKRYNKTSKSDIINVLQEVGMDNLINRHPLSLSGGQKQRLLLALAGISGKEVLVFDEPTSGQDGYNMRLTGELLKELAQKGHCIVLITHDTELIATVATSIIYMQKGKVMYHRNIN